MLLSKTSRSVFSTSETILHVSQFGTDYCLITQTADNRTKIIHVVGADYCGQFLPNVLTRNATSITCSLCESTVLVCIVGKDCSIYQTIDLINFESVYKTHRGIKIFDYVEFEGSILVTQKNQLKILHGPFYHYCFSLHLRSHENHFTMIKNTTGKKECFLVGHSKESVRGSNDFVVTVEIKNLQGKSLAKGWFDNIPRNLITHGSIAFPSNNPYQQFVFSRDSAKWDPKLFTRMPRHFRELVLTIAICLQRRELPNEITQIIVNIVINYELWFVDHPNFDKKLWRQAAPNYLCHLR